MACQSTMRGMLKRGECIAGRWAVTGHRVSCRARYRRGGSGYHRERGTRARWAPRKLAPYAYCAIDCHAWCSGVTRMLRRRLHAIARVASPPRPLLIQELLTHVNRGLEGLFVPNAEQNRKTRTTEKISAPHTRCTGKYASLGIHLGDDTKSDSAYIECAHLLTRSRL